MTSPESVRYFRGSWKEFSWHLNRNERIREVGKATFDMQAQIISNPPLIRKYYGQMIHEIGRKWKKKTTYCLFYEEIKLLHGSAVVRVWHVHLKCLYICMYVCNCKYAPKTFNQSRGSLRKFPLVKYLLIAEAYNEVNENNTLIIDSCCSGEYNSHII